MRSVLTGDALDAGCNVVRSRIGNSLYSKMELGAACSLWYIWYLTQHPREFDPRVHYCFSGPCNVIHTSSAWLINYGTFLSVCLFVVMQVAAAASCVTS
jgi:hypothetical protein